MSALERLLNEDYIVGYGPRREASEPKSHVLAEKHRSGVVIYQIAVSGKEYDTLDDSTFGQIDRGQTDKSVHRVRTPFGMSVLESEDPTELDAVERSLQGKGFQPDPTFYPPNMDDYIPDAVQATLDYLRDRPELI